MTAYESTVRCDVTLTYENSLNEFHVKTQPGRHPSPPETLPGLGQPTLVLLPGCIQHADLSKEDVLLIDGYREKTLQWNQKGKEYI